MQIHQYIKLGTYENSMRFIEEFERLGGIANTTVNGVSASAEVDIWVEIEGWLENNSMAYELLDTHPAKGITINIEDVACEIEFNDPEPQSLGGLYRDAIMRFTVPKDIYTHRYKYIQPVRFSTEFLQDKTAFSSFIELEKERYLEKLRKLLMGRVS